MFFIGKQTKTKPFNIKNTIYIVFFRNRLLKKRFVKGNCPIHILHTYIA